MNYYEELGISRRASVEEIRHAYRNLARILHPDQQSEESLRLLASIQMTRLNRILAVLTDLRSRAAYDLTLEREIRAVSPRHDAGLRSSEEYLNKLSAPVRDWGRLLWLCAAGIGVTLIVLLLAEESSGNRPTQPDEVSVLSAATPDVVAGAWPAPSQRRFSSPSAARRVDKNATREREATDSPFGKSPAAAAANSAPFQGAWYYATSNPPVSPNGICPPKFIAMEISGDPASLEGTYSAQYLVGERSVSPSVEFQFEATVRGSKAELTWNGAGGAKGRGRLTLLSPRTLRVEWAADVMGNVLGLSSGTATLVRRGIP